MMVLLMEKAKWYCLLMSNYGWIVRYLIELKGKSGKVPFGSYNVLTDKESVMQLLGVLIGIYDSL